MNSAATGPLTREEAEAFASAHFKKNISPQEREIGIQGLMKAPNHEGTVTLTHEGRAVPLRFTWAVIHQLQQDHGLDGWMEAVASAVDNLDMQAMARLMGLVANVPEEEARALCVPVLPAKAALTQAWTVGMTGNGPAEDDAEKTTPQLTLWGLLSKLRFGQASAGASSGTSPPTPPGSSAAPMAST